MFNGSSQYSPLQRRFTFSKKNIILTKAMSARPNGSLKVYDLPFLSNLSYGNVYNKSEVLFSEN